MLEFLTGKLNEQVEGGLYCYYCNSEEREEELSLEHLDGRAGDWPAELGQALIEMAVRCTGNHRRRPTMRKLLGDLRALER